jgi:hypothetical protein
MTSKQNTILRTVTRLIAAAALSAGLAACSGVRSYEFVAIDEIPPGPGLFSGEDGEFVIYRR